MFKFEVSLWDAAVAQRRKVKRKRNITIKSASMSRFRDDIF